MSLEGSNGEHGVSARAQSAERPTGNCAGLVLAKPRFQSYSTLYDRLYRVFCLVGRATQVPSPFLKSLDSKKTAPWETPTENALGTPVGKTSRNHPLVKNLGKPRWKNALWGNSVGNLLGKTPREKPVGARPPWKNALWGNLALREKMFCNLRILKGCAAHIANSSNYPSSCRPNGRDKNKKTKR